MDSICIGLLALFGIGGREGECAFVAAANDGAVAGSDVVSHGAYVESNDGNKKKIYLWLSVRGEIYMMAITMYFCVVFEIVQMNVLYLMDTLYLMNILYLE